MMQKNFDKHDRILCQTKISLLNMLNMLKFQVFQFKLLNSKFFQDSKFSGNPVLKIG